MFITACVPKVPKKTLSSVGIYWKTEEGRESVDGLLYGNCQDQYAVLLPSNLQSKFGESLTFRYRKARWEMNGFYVIAGAARMETNESTVIGELNDSGLWINGRLEIDRDTKRIFYRKYDRKGKKIKNSTREFVDFNWVKSTKGKVAEKNLGPDKKKHAAEKKKHNAEKKKHDDKKKKHAAEKRKSDTEDKKHFNANKKTTTQKKKPAAKKKKPAAEKKKHAAEKKEDDEKDLENADEEVDEEEERIEEEKCDVEEKCDGEEESDYEEEIDEEDEEDEEDELDEEKEEDEEDEVDEECPDTRREADTRILVTGIPDPVDIFEILLNFF